MLWETLKSAPDLGRLHELASILIRYGFGDIVQRLGMTSLLKKAGKVLNWKDVVHIANMESPERVRNALEEMGPTFVKLGQILATRVDLFTPEWITEFEKLQDQVPAQPFESLRAQVEENLGDSPENIFSHLDTKAFAVGSIAQVHRARTESGEEVVIKIRHSGIRPVVEADLRLLERLADIAESEITELRRYQPTRIVQQVSRSLRRELDLASECRYAERIAESFADDENILVPMVYWQWTSERLNVQEFIDGIPARDIDNIKNAGLDCKLLARLGANAVLKMILEDGFFHADPHPGNIYCLPENHIAFIDFGMTGYLSERRREQLVDLIRGLVKRETEQVINVMHEWSGDVLIQTENLASDIDAFLDNYHSVPLKQLNIATMLADLTVIMRDYELVMPPDLALLIKVFITLEGLGRQLDPDFDMAAEATPFYENAIFARYQPEIIAKRSWKNLLELANILSDLPRDIRHLLRNARRGAIQISVEITTLDRFANELDRAASRITVGLVTSALIIGTSIVMTVKGGPTLFGLPILGLFGFMSAGIGGTWLLISIWHGGHDKYN
jgi:ubiquinone biosynthesis protein